MPPPLFLLGYRVRQNDILGFEFPDFFFHVLMMVAKLEGGANDFARQENKQGEEEEEKTSVFHEKIPEDILERPAALIVGQQS